MDRRRRGGGALVGVAAWQAGSLQVGLLLSGGFVALTFVLHLAGVALIRAVQPLRFSRSFALRQAVLHVARPGNQTRIILLAVGLGTFFILGVRALQVNLLQDFSVQVGEDAPDMFLMDIQSDQRDGLAALDRSRERRRERSRSSFPVLRARIVGVRGRDVNLESYEDVRGRGGLSREFTITYRSTLEANEKLVDGEWWDAGAGRRPAEVSIEEGLRERFKIQIGDEMRFDVLGRIVSARVTSFREVDFRDFRAGGFMIVFRPGSVRQRTAQLHRRGQRREGHRCARAPAGADRRQLPEHLGHRSARSARHHQDHRRQRHAGGHRRRRRSCFSAAA